MSTRIPCAIALSALLAAAGCATARPDFEQSFARDSRSSQDWSRLLISRYGCSIACIGMAMRSASQSFGQGAEVCVAAAFVWPERVRAWRTDRGVREDWEYVAAAAGSGGYSRRRVAGRCTLSLEGPTERTLRVVNLVC